MVASLDEVGEFASSEVLTTLEERYADGRFSPELWRSMGEMGLLGLTVPERYGGPGGTPEQLADSLREFTRQGRDLGLALSWITHLSLCVKTIERFGTGEQKERYLPGLVSGELVGAVAISEPGTGAHPAGMETLAARRGNGYSLTGSKVYITDGPVADLLVVLAVTGELPGGGKELTTFLVESGKPGFTVQPMELTFLKTAPHGEIEMEEVPLEEGDVIGKAGEGHSEVSRSAFARERSSVAAALSGHFEAAASEVANRYKQKHEGFELEGTDAGSWIHHMSALEVYRRTSNQLVEASFSDYQDWKESIDLLIYLGLSYGKWGFWLAEFVGANKLEPTFPLDIILNDMKLVFVGERLLLGEGRKRYIG